VADLSEAEDTVREAIECGEVPAIDYSLPIVMAEYDRMRTNLDDYGKRLVRTQMTVNELAIENERLRGDAEQLREVVERERPSVGDMILELAQLRRAVSILAAFVETFSGAAVQGVSDQQWQALAEARRVLAELGTTTEEKR
jgi:hypothetical protein